MMDSRRALEEPPALPPKLYKTHRKELRKDFPVRSPVPPKESSSNHSATKTPTPKPPRLDYRRHGENRLLNIDVSDLRGKSRDEIVLMLLQLKREKANLNRWRHYFEEELTRLTPAAEADPKARREFDDLCLKLKDVEGQLAASVPLINFMNKIIRMNDLYASDEEPFASEYEKPNRSSSRRKSFEFVRRLEEKEVAQALEEGMSRSNTPPLPTRSLGIVTSAELFRRKRQQSVQSRVNLEDYPEDFSIRSRRLQLEEELRQLDELWKEASSIRTVSESAPRPTAPYSSSVNSRRQQTPVTKRVALRRCDQTEAVRPRSESSAYVPRRSTKLRPRSDLISSFSADLDRRALSQLDVALDYPASPHAYRSQRPASSAEVNGPPEPLRRRQRFASVSSPTTTRSASHFLTEPATSVRSRWKVLEADVEQSAKDWVQKSSHVESAFESPQPSPPPPLPPPPIPAKPITHRNTTPDLPPRMNRWKSFGENLVNVNPYLEPVTSPCETSLEASLNPRNSLTHNRFSKNPPSDGVAGTGELFQKPGVSRRKEHSDSLHLPSEDPYEETPRFDSQYLTPRTAASYEQARSPTSTRMNRKQTHEVPLSPSTLRAAVDYEPGESVCESTDATATDSHTYPPNLSEMTRQLSGSQTALVTPRPVYPHNVIRREATYTQLNI